ncbi:MAG: hypothetical protein F6J90_18325 [Moorea sp. SIOASIH]|uniref:hypothetical protein n=1 Tax=Moorena sp. SIOASIH TaxID=2607817 RepID=UPI0013BAAFE2|nr:hypothetical protein [Moorena sp. SIOASIH]NEO38178.1 hypothetical protein [Moorena sp. SIOASIH]
MEISTIIQAFTQALKTHSEKFEIEDLQDLSQILSPLDTPTEDELDDLLTDWLQTHTEVRDTVLPFAETDKELNTSPKLPSNSEAGIIQNLFELRQTNQEVIKAKTNQQDQDKSKH